MEQKKYADLTAVTVCGRLAADCREFATQAGKKGIGYKVLANCGWGDKMGTVAFDCAQWGDNLANLAPYLTKGRAVTVSGRIDSVEAWESNGKSGLAIKVSVSAMQLGQEPRGQQGQQSAPAPAHDKPDFSGDLAESDVPF